MLSESLSLSFFALLIGILLLLRPDSVKRKGLTAKVISLAGGSTVLVLYSFSRDSNAFFILHCALVIIAAVLARKVNGDEWKVYAACVACAVSVFTVQTISISLGNRWIVPYYDHLVLRVIPDARALKYYEDNGLPVSGKLLATPSMVGYEYQALISSDPDMGPLRDWIRRYGRIVYLKYLVHNPLEFISQPFANSEKLLDGSNIEYRKPTYPSLEIPERIKLLSRHLYPTSPAILVGMLLPMMFVTARYWFRYGHRGHEWLVTQVLIVSIIPSMFMIWYSEPLEIERHSVQIGVQFRLVAWMVIILLLDRILNRKGAMTDAN